MKGVKKIQSFENFGETQPHYNNFKKVLSTDNFIPPELEFDVNPMF